MRLFLDIDPTPRDLLETFMREGLLAELVHAGACLRQAGCNSCIGMGQAPATGRYSPRTVPRNFPRTLGHAREDSVFLCIPETAGATEIAVGESLDSAGLPARHRR